MGILLILSLLCTAPVWAANSPPMEFTLEVPPEAPLYGPVPLKVTAKNTGREPIDVLSFAAPPPLGVSVEPPPGSTPYRPLGLRGGSVSGMIQKVTVQPGAALERTVYLHDFVSSLQPGPTELSVSVDVSPLAPGADALRAAVPSISVKQTARVNLRPDSPEALRARVERIYAAIKAASDDRAAEERYSSILGLNHPVVIDVLLAALVDSKAFSIRSKAQVRLLELTEINGQRDKLIDYLVSAGNRADAWFVTRWAETKVRLTPQQKDRLYHAGNPWMRLYAVEYLGRDGEVPPGVLDTLDQEAQDLSSAVKRLRELRH